jgi:hypothetical protein
MEDYGIPLGKLFFVGLLSVILTVDVVMGLLALYDWQSDVAQNVESLYQRPAKLEDAIEDQKKLLAEYRVVDAKKGIVGVPIDRAMELVVDRLSREGVAPKGGSP